MTERDGGASGKPEESLSKYQEALHRLKDEPAEERTPEAPPDFVAQPEEKQEPSQEPNEASFMGFLDDLARKHGLEAGGTAPVVPDPVSSGPTPEVGSAPASDAPRPEASPEASSSAGKALDWLQGTGLESDEPSTAPNAVPEGPASSVDHYKQALERLKDKQEPVEQGPAKVQPDAAEPQAAEAERLSRLREGAKAEQEAEASEHLGDSKGYRRPAERLQGRASLAPKEKRKPRRIRAKELELPQAQSVEAGPATTARRKARMPGEVSEERGDGVLSNLPPWSVEPLLCLAVLVAGLALQLLVYLALGTAFGAREVAAGVIAALPGTLVLALVAPETRREWGAVIGSVAALGLVGSLAFAFCLAATQSAALADVSIVVALFVQLGILTMLLGPVFLIVAAVLHRLELIELTDPLYA
jgi:hypothetical protein